MLAQPCQAIFLWCVLCAQWARGLILYATFARYLVSEYGQRLQRKDTLSAQASILLSQARGTYLTLKQPHKASCPVRGWWLA